MLKRVITAILTVLFINSSSFADEDGTQSDEQQPYVPTPYFEDRHQQASDASFDKRLPPVLPGEIVSDSGKKMRVWSSAGPVPVGKAPEPWDNQDSGVGSDGDNSGLPEGTEIIIDRRGRDR